MKRFLFCALAVLGLAWATPSFAARTCATPTGVMIQACSDGNATTGNSLAIAFQSSNGANRLLIASASACPNSSCLTGIAGLVWTVSDTANGTYSQSQVNIDPNAIGLIIAIFPHCAAGANTVTFSVAGVAQTNYLTATISEFQITGVSPLDVCAKANGNSTTPSVTSAATNQATELVYAYLVNIGGPATPAAPYTAMNSTFSPQWKEVVATGAQTANGTSATGVWGAVVCTFKEDVVSGTKHLTTLGAD